jgi:hypothetical protein
MTLLASDGVESHRGTVARHGGPRSRRLRLPDDADVAAGDLLRVTVDGRDGFARVAADAEGRYLGGVYANRRLARTDGAGDDRLAAWLVDTGVGPGESVAVDALDPGHHYGLRQAGDRVVDTVSERRDDSLAAIAERVDGDG